MPSIKIELISSIKKLQNSRFMHLYLQLMELTEKYVAITENEHIKWAFKNMQKEVERVKQLDVKLNVRSETVKARNEVHQNIKNSIQLIKKLLESELLSPKVNDRVNAKYACRKLEDLIDLKLVTSIHSTIKAISIIKQTIEDDKKLADSLKELDLMKRVELLYTLGEEFEQLEMQKNIENVTAPVINKKDIRKEATRKLKLLFDSINVNHSLTKEEVWVEVGDEVKRVVTGSIIDNEMH